MRNTALLITLCLFCLTANATGEKPRIVNIINFIRQVEPRSAEITEDVLYETVHEQVKLLTKYKLTGTFLLQYDALINQRYQELLKKETERGTEVGAWWEITQPHVEAAGLKWRGMARGCRFCHRIFAGRKRKAGGCIYGKVQIDLWQISRIRRFLVHRCAFIGIYV